MKNLIITAVFILAFCFSAFGQTESNSNCPEIKVTGPFSVVQPDENMDFTAEVSGIDRSKIGYKWTVSEGKIIKGQGTNKISVSIEGLYDNAIKATVEILNLPEGCPYSASETVIITIHFIAVLINEINNSSKLDYKGLDTVINELKAKPDSKLYIIFYPDRKGSVKKAKTKLDQIEKYLSEKEISADRIVMVEGDEGKDLIRFWLVPPGAEPPTP